MIARNSLVVVLREPQEPSKPRQFGRVKLVKRYSILLVKMQQVRFNYNSDMRDIRIEITYALRHGTWRCPCSGTVLVCVFVNWYTVVFL